MKKKSLATESDRASAVLSAIESVTLLALVSEWASEVLSASESVLLLGHRTMQAPEDCPNHL